MKKTLRKKAERVLEVHPEPLLELPVEIKSHPTPGLFFIQGEIRPLKNAKNFPGQSSF